MIEQIQPAAPPSSAGAETAARPAPQAQAGSPPEGGAPSADASEAPTRLYVEQQDGRYVYRIMDVATGRVLLEVPREQVDDLKTFVSSSGASLVSTTA